MNTWNIDTAHSGIGFAVRHMVVARTRGKFGSWRGEVHMDEANPERSRVDVTIDAASIDTGVADRDAHLRSADFLDVANHPAITFASKRLEPRGGDRYRVVGDLTIRGVTREVALDMEASGQATDPWGNLRAGFSARAQLDRKDFGLTWNQVLETGGVLVGDRIDIEIEVEAVRAASVRAA
jgi:polyisoprenoid-binding protein YceI